MKVKEGFVLRKIAGESVVVAAGERAREMRNIIVLSESAALLWDSMQHDFTQEQLEAIIMDSYDDVSLDVAREDITKFLDYLRHEKVLEE